jgi:hypothetical protein
VVSVRIIPLQDSVRILGLQVLLERLLRIQGLHSVKRLPHLKQMPGEDSANRLINSNRHLVQILQIKRINLRDSVDSDQLRILRLQALEDSVRNLQLPDLEELALAPTREEDSVATLLRQEDLDWETQILLRQALV